ncbi:uroporphyrinogen-III synthase [Ornithinimicrobium pekingense]|uniref:uroporphyrinogen-III C-methyltransferase n=1 Tax=Ornithinimicrobium pekingense TaxID=384677 RepID=A0ABQ2F3I5_9MICO|nr:uroporphyrinogen-III synthase [Ornithinimicrobium pekingense]GGK58464.1 bifunctional uroporphyrinogen-III C-methyltransferase/uroporphyrinogen-III synthase [Ornithinimicrobium pekingense]
MSTQAASLPVPPPATAARVAFVGAGPGDPGLLTVRARDYLAAADVVLLDTIHHVEQLRAWTREDVEFVVTTEQSPSRAGRPMGEDARAQLLVRTATRFGAPSHLVVRLMDGDPTAFTGLTVEALACREAGVPFEIVPGVSTAWSVPAYAGVPLSTHEGAGSLHMVSAADPQVDWTLSAREDITVVILGCGEPLTAALRRLAEAGRDPQSPVALTQHGTTVTQHTSVTTLETAIAALSSGKSECPDASVAVVGQQVELRAELSWYETKPLFGWSILVPRTKEQAEPMTERIASYGATSAVVPTISVEPPRTPQQMDRAVKGLVTGRYEWVGFTSVNAVRAVREKFEALGLDARAFSGLKLAAVGGVTADALRDWGLEPDLVPEEEQSALGLLQAWPPYDEVLDPINRVFLPRADIATDTLVAGLQEAGWEVDDVTAYRTVRAAPPPAPVREAIKGGAFDAVCFTSSSTVRNLVGIAGKPHPTTVVACIGPATAKTAEEHGLRVDVVAPEASSLALVDALAQHARGVAAAAQAEGRPVLRPSQQRAAGRRSRARR